MERWRTPAEKAEGGGAGQFEQVVDERSQPVDFEVGFRRLLPGLATSAPNGLQPQLEAGQRSPELVRGVRDEVALGGDVRA